MQSRFTLAALVVALLAMAAPASLAQNFTDGGITPPTRINPTQDITTLKGGSATYYASRVDCDNANPGLPTEDFEAPGAPGPGGVTSFDPPLNAATSNGVYEPGDLLPGIEMDVILNGGSGQIAALGDGLVGNSTVVAGANSFSETTRLRFSPNVQVVCLDFMAGAGAGPNLTITAYDAADGVIGSQSIPTTGGTQFFGLLSTGNAIARVDLDDGGNSIGELVDNVAFGGGMVGPSIDIAINTHTNNPMRGESVFHRGPVTNNGAASQFVYVYFTVDLPGGGTFKRNLGGITLGPGQTFLYKDFPKSKNYIPLPLNAPAGTYTITVYAASDNAGTIVYDSDSFSFDLPPLPVEVTTASLPGAMSLEAVEPGAAPNPFRDATTFTYAVAEDAPVDLRVYDALGREVASLVTGTQSAGTHTATLRAGDLPGGVYVWRLAIGGEVTTGRITLAR